MQLIRAALITALIAGSASARAADPKYDEDWTAFGNVLTLVQQMIRIGNHPYPDQAMADLLAGRNYEANQAIASLFAGATAEMPPEYRDKLASMGRDLATMAIRPVPGAVNAISADRSLQARKDLTAMGLKYYDQEQFYDAAKRGDLLATELFIAGKGVDPSARAWSGRTALDMARDNGHTQVADLIARSLPSTH
ncbi:MAG TPA: hypothetical protein VNU64_15335 [Burkholderiales bacterium]|nr:hypothetical protein [Burkholderiales bacterium]